MVGLARSGLIELPLLISDVLVYLYWEEMLLLAGSPSRKDRDRFVFGAEDGVRTLRDPCKTRILRAERCGTMRLGAMLQALPDFRRIPGIDAPLTSGTNWRSLPALPARSAKGLGSRVFCFLEEKDCLGKDFMLEAEMCAGYGLDNITLISVCKDKAGTDPGSYPESMGRLKTYGWDIFETDGNDFGSMEKVFSEADCGSGRPAAVYAKVSNGRGLSFAGDDAPKIKMSMETMERALEELEGKTNG